MEFRVESINWGEIGTLVDIGTEWNLEVIGSMSYPVEASVDIGTEWNLEDIVPERIVITGWSRYRNRVEFRA